MKIIAIATLLLISLLPLHANATPLDYGAVFGREIGGAVLYAEKSTESEQLGLFYNGNAIAINAYDDGWAHVRVGPIYAAYEGFIRTTDCFLAYEVDLPADFRSGMQCASLGGNDEVALHARPTEQSDVYGCYLSGTIVLVQGETKGWYYVNIGEWYGFVNKNEVVFDVEFAYDETGYPVIPFYRTIWLDTQRDSIAMYAKTIHDEPALYPMSEILAYGDGRCRLIADLGDWYYVTYKGHYHYIQRDCFLQDQVDVF